MRGPCGGNVVQLDPTGGSVLVVICGRNWVKRTLDLCHLIHLPTNVPLSQNTKFAYKHVERTCTATVTGGRRGSVDFVCCEVLALPRDW